MRFTTEGDIQRDVEWAARPPRAGTLAWEGQSYIYARAVEWAAPIAAAWRAAESRAIRAAKAELRAANVPWQQLAAAAEAAVAAQTHEMRDAAEAATARVEALRLAVESEQAPTGADLTRALEAGRLARECADAWQRNDAAAAQVAGGALAAVVRATLDAP